LFDFLPQKYYISKNRKLMKNKLINNHNETIRLFVKINGIEKQVDILPGESIIVDNYETKTMKVFSKRGFIFIESTEDSNYLIQQNKTTQANNQVEIKNNPSIIVDEILEIEDKVENPIIYKDSSLTKLEIIENEVEQYVEGGFIKGEWSDEDEAFLKKYYPIKGRKYCSTNLNRNETSVQKKINSLGLKKKKKKK